MREMTKRKVLEEICRFIQENAWGEYSYVYYNRSRYDLGSYFIGSGLEVAEEVANWDELEYVQSGFMAVTYDGSLLWDIMNGDYNCIRDKFKLFIENLEEKYKKYGIEIDYYSSWCFVVYENHR